MGELTKTALNKEIDRYIENKDFGTAKNLAETLGKTVNKFDIAGAVERIEKAKNEVI